MHQVPIWPICKKKTQGGRVREISRLILLFSALLIFASCRKTVPNKQQARIQNAEKFTDIFRLEKSIRLHFPGALRVENIVDVLLLPNRKLCILTSGSTAAALFFDLEGRFLKKLHPGGKFIKNFGQPWQIELDPDNSLNILDLRRHKIFIFDSEGSYLGQRNAPAAASSFRISKANQFYFNLPVATEETTILALYKNGRPSRSFSLMPATVQEVLSYKTIIPKRPLLTFDHENNIFQAFPVAGTIYKFGADYHYKGSFGHPLQRYRAPDIAAWRQAARSNTGNFQTVLSQTTLFSGLHNPALKILMAEFMNIADRQPRFLAFFTTDGEFLNGDILYDRDRHGTILRADNERLFTCRAEKKGTLANFTLNVYLIPRN